MDKLKKSGIVAGAIIGGVIGGTLSVIGKVSKIKIIDDIGESVIDSTILTGSMAGNLASGTADAISGKVRHDEVQRREGIKDIKDTGGQVVDNFVENLKLMAGSGEEIITGVKNKNPKTVKRGVKSLAKIISVGALTVGAIKVKDDNNE